MIRKIFFFTTVMLLSVVLSCTRENKTYETSNRLKVTEANGSVFPVSAGSSSRIIHVDQKKLRKIVLGTPKVFLSETNIRPSGKPSTVVAGDPDKVIPGNDKFIIPEKASAIERQFLAGLPEISIVKDISEKSQNPENFSVYGKKQGLKHSSVTCLIEDRLGNLWLGTHGGVSKFDGKFFSHYTVTEGLNNHMINSMLQDRSGNLWFGTYGGGVTKFDGKKFTHYTTKEGLNNDDVRCILEDKSGNLWFGTFGGGVSKFDGKFFTYFNESGGLSNNNVSGICEDRQGTIWFSTWNGITKYDGKCLYQYTDKQGLNSNHINCIEEDRKGNLWFGTSVGTTKFDGHHFYHFTSKEGIGNNPVSCILEDGSGDLWFGHSLGGVSRYDGKNFYRFTEEEGLGNDDVISILEDQSGTLWFGTNGGVSRYDGKCFTYISGQDMLRNPVIYGILQDRSGNFWFGSMGGGVTKYDGKSFTHFTEKEGLISNVVFSVLEDRLGHLWFGTDKGVSKFDGLSFTQLSEKDGLINNYVFVIREDHNGNLWFGTDEGISRYDGQVFENFTVKEGLANNIVYSILEDRQGNLWFGTLGSGVSKYDGKKFVNFSQKEGLCSNYIFSILEDRAGNIWFGTNGGGITRYDGRFFTHVTEKEGLSSNFVAGILEDKTGDLWFGTRFGLSKISREKLAILNYKTRTDGVKGDDVFFKNYTYADGFQGIGCNRNAMVESRSGTILIGTNDRVTIFHPEGDIYDTIPPNIQLTSVEIFNESIDWALLERKKDSCIILANGAKIENFRFDSVNRWFNYPDHLNLSYDNNYLNFNFIGITMVKPGKVRYQYKLEGLDNNWSALSFRNSASYSNLPNGSYTFKVKAMNSEGFWSKDFSYPFTIRPPWWLTWWMYTIYCFMIIGCVVFIVWWNGKRLRKRAKELELEVNKATSVIKEQKEAVESEKKKSDELLLNILPYEVAEELKHTGHCQAKTFSMVTVMFADFKDFTTVSEKVSAELLVDEINFCFSAFDRILPKYKVEKIKTVGDAYICVSGLPVLNFTHAFDLVSAAIEIKNFMLNRKLEKESRGEIPFQLRIGIHTGPVVAGIVGVKKFQYDIWGDTVNLAARMESSSEAGQINISGATHALIKDKFKCEHRGKIVAKNKGELDMYFVL